LITEFLSTNRAVIPHEGQPCAHCHPDRLATLARLFGMRPAPVDCCRVLELGCGNGGNLACMAAALPESRFLGIDLAPQQLGDGQFVVDAVPLPNIEVRRMTILDVDARLGQFDYILAHAALPWVSPAIQDKMLEICAKHLAPNGVAYAGYNTYPGWSLRGMIRDWMSCHCAHCADVRALLDSLIESALVEKSAYRSFLKAELETLRHGFDDRPLHECVEGVNEPIYFSQFAHRAAAKGLQYLGETRLGAMVHNQRTTEVSKSPRSNGMDLIQMEQHTDFLRNRTFRQSLLCHQSIALKRVLSAECLRGLFVASPAKPVAKCPDIHSSGVEQFRTQGGILSIRQPIVKAALRYLGEVWPRRVRFETLLVTARCRVNSAPQHRSTSADDWQILGTSLLECFASASELVELHAHAPRIG
jgi:SAM-dependent methyltransferase